jgi:hypothetical protein
MLAKSLRDAIELLRRGLHARLTVRPRIIHGVGRLVNASWSCTEYAENLYLQECMKARFGGENYIYAT